MIIKTQKTAYFSFNKKISYSCSRNTKYEIITLHVASFFIFKSKQ